ncbi:hypothetical protein FRB96_004593 [Tulasnella sp. 330]|nr:hypothetical protein FRB96_004593 [Tulasnella sp. 330]
MAQSKNKATPTTTALSTSTPGAGSSTKRKNRKEINHKAIKNSERHPNKRLPKRARPKTQRPKEQAASSSKRSAMATADSSTSNGIGGDYVAFEREVPEARSDRRSKGKGKASNGANRVDVATYHSNNGLTPWAEKVDWDDCINAAEMLQCEVEAFVDWMSPRREEHELRTLVVEQIRRAVQKAYPKAEVTAFGSYETVLYLPSGDLDLVLTIPDIIDPLKVLFKLPNIITRNGVGKAITVISKARVPIVKFTSLIGVAFILEMHPKIRNGEINPMHNLGVLVIEFFELYGHYFQYEMVGISLRNGGCYFRKDDRGWAKLNKPSLLSIEDPNMESNDVSGGSHAIDKVRRTFAGAFEVLNATMIQRSIEIESRTPPKGSRSILGTLVGVSKTMYDRRKTIHDIYCSGILQDVLGMPVRRAPPIPRPSMAWSTRDVEDLPTSDPSTSLATLAESKAAASNAHMTKHPEASEGQNGDRRKRKRTPSVEIMDPPEEGEVKSSEEAEDSRYGAVQPKLKRKAAIDIVFVSDDEASDGVERVTNIVEADGPGTDEPGASGMDSAPKPPLPSDSSLKSAARREFWRAKAGDPSAFDVDHEIERIAALNKRAQPAQPTPQPAGVAIATSPSGSKSVKDKAARFDHLGVAPAPRSSFGLGAPVAASQKTNRELYGNRITSVGKDTKLLQSGSTTSIRSASPGPLHSLRSELSNPSPPSPSHSRTSSIDSTGASLARGHAQAAVPTEPLTEAAVESLGAAVRLTPLSGIQAFKSVPPSIFAGEHDASSSVAVEADDVDVAVDNIDITGILSRTNSTVSESALREVPPFSSSDSTSSLLADQTPRHSFDEDTSSSFATARSASSVKSPDSPEHQAITTITSVDDVAGLHRADGYPEHSAVIKSAVAPLPLSSHLLETLQVNAPKLDTPSRSVVVETGSGGGNQMDDVAEAFEGVDLSEKALDASLAAGGSDTGKGEDVELDVQPDLRLQAPVLPLSSAHLRSLNVQSSLAPSSGYDTPRSMAVEVGDGSVDGRSIREISLDENSIDQEYITSEGLSDMYTPPGSYTDLSGEGARSANASPLPQSPAKMSGRGFGSPLTPTRRLGAPDGAPRKSSLSALQLPTKPSDVVEMTTPIADTTALPEEHTTPPAGGKPRCEEVELNEQPFPASSFNGLKTDESKNVAFLNPGGSNNGRVTLPPRERTSPSLLSRKNIPAVVLPPPSVKDYAAKPLPPPPPPSLTPTSPNTPIILQAFPQVPEHPVVPSLDRPSLMFPTTSSRSRSRSSVGSSPSSPLLTPRLIARPMRTPSPSLSPMATMTVLSPPSPRHASGSQSPRPRPQTTYDGDRDATTSMTTTQLRQSMSVTSLQEPTARRRPKRPKLVPGVWIGDDDVRSDDEEETGWANIVVTKHVIW